MIYLKKYVSNHTPAEFVKLRNEIHHLRSVIDILRSQKADLLEACENFISHIDSFGGSFLPKEINGSIDKIRAAVAKAEGKE